MSLDWDAIIIAMITAAPPTLVAGLAIWQALKTHGIVNHKMDTLLETVRKESAAQATLDEKAAEHIRKGEAAVIAAKTTEDTQ